MNEDERNSIVNQERPFVASWREKGYPDSRLRPTHDVATQIQADVARQLTRIADRIEAIIHYDVPDPTPDVPPAGTLVEAVKKVVNTIRLTGHNGNCGRSLCSHCETIKALKNALEEHQNRKEARADANNMNLDPGEFPPTEVSHE